MATVAVIIPTFNRAAKVARAVSSVLYQDLKDYEMIVVDDGSSDDTSKILRQFKQHVKYLFLPSNTGVSAARNWGIRETRAPYITFLDSDDYWLPQKLSVQIDFFNAHPEAVACQTDEIWIRNGRRVNPMKKHLKPSGDVFEPSLRRCLVSPSAVMLKRSLLEQVGLFDEGLPACEDYDLWLRVSSRYPIHLITKKLVVKEGGHADQLSSRYQGMMDQFRITALRKLVKAGDLNERQLRATMEELATKCTIYGNGCIKRGKMKEGTYYLGIPRTLGEAFFRNNLGQGHISRQGSTERGGPHP